MRIIAFAFFITIISNGVFSQDSLTIVDQITPLDTISTVSDSIVSLPKEEESFVNNEDVKIELQEFEVDVIDILVLDTVLNNIPSLYVLIPESEKKRIIKAWTKQTRNKTKLKYTNEGSDYEIRLSLLKRIHHLPLQPQNTLY